MGMDESPRPILTVAASTGRSGHFALPLATLTGVRPKQLGVGSEGPTRSNPSTMIPYQTDGFDARSAGGVERSAGHPWVIAAWLNDPTDPLLPVGIGEPAGAVLASLSPDPSTVTFTDDRACHGSRCRPARLGRRPVLYGHHLVSPKVAPHNTWERGQHDAETDYLSITMLLAGILFVQDSRAQDYTPWGLPDGGQWQ